jgi:hypothetical protein
VLIKHFFELYVFVVFEAHQTSLQVSKHAGKILEGIVGLGL